MNTFQRSIERLSHFCCTICRKWWSIGDAPERDYWYCPWCGTRLGRNDGDGSPEQAFTE